MGQDTSVRKWAQAEYSASRYVQDDLIAMWDGIENAGQGVHSLSTSNWVDLTGHGWDLVDMKGRAAVLPRFECGYAQLNGNYFYVNDSWAWGKKSAIPAAAQIEVVSKTDEVRSQGCICEFVNSGICIHHGAATPRLDTVGNGVQISGFVQTDINSYSFDITDLTDIKAYHNGAAAVVRSVSGFRQMNKNGLGFDGWYDNSTHEFHGKIYCIRLYSRALTTEEVAANYGIDQLRFGIS